MKYFVDCFKKLSLFSKVLAEAEASVVLVVEMFHQICFFQEDTDLPYFHLENKYVLMRSVALSTALYIIYIYI